MRGGEKVLENICDLYPDADIFTHVYNPICISDKINSHNVYTTFINRLPFVKKYYQYYLPLMPIALKKINLNKYDLIISCESGPSKGINKYNAKHICYCHTPMRYLWDMHDIYYENYNVIAKLGMKIFIKYLRKWDLESSFNIDRIITNSKFVSNRIAKYWNKESFVVYPGIDTSKCKKDNIDNNYYLIISEIVSYKRIDLAIEAFANLYWDIADSLTAYRADERYENTYVFGLEHSINGLELFSAAKQSNDKRCWVENNSSLFKSDI